jgi:spoIIIJ-associated protein
VVGVASSAEGSGKTVEAAIEAARAELGVPGAEFDVEVLAEPVPSSFGVIGSPARVRVTLRGAQAAASVAPVAPSEAASPPEAAVTSGGSPPEVLTSASGAQTSATASGATVETAPMSPGAPPSTSRNGDSERPVRRSEARASRPPIAVDPEVATQQAELAGDFVEGLLELLDLEADITTWADDNGGHVEAEGPELTVLVGRDGETLAALEEVTRLAVARASGERTRLGVDVNGFRKQRREELTLAAREAADRVLRDGTPEELPPMSPYERKIVHDVVAEMQGLQTDSVGEEPRRRVQILPA